jgi:hypothetical protein
MRKLGLSFLTVLAVISSLVLPSQLAQAAPAVSLVATKTVTVTDHNGAPYAGAQVAFGYTPAGGDQLVFTPIAVTNSRGVAQVDTSGLSASAYIDGLVVQPPASDLINATYFGYSGTYLIGGENFSVQLGVANAHVRLLNADGSDAPAGTVLQGTFSNRFGGDSYARKTLRTGAFGIDLAQVSDPNQLDTLALSTGTWTNNFGHSYVVKADPAAQSFSPLIYADANAVDPLTKIGGVYNLSFDLPPVSGSIVDAAGGQLAFGNFVSGRVYLVPAGIDGSVQSNTNPWMNNSSVSSFDANGQFKMVISNLPAGKYFPIVQIGGSTTLPSFVAEPVWLNTAGNISANPNAAFVAPQSFRLNLRVPMQAPNLKIIVQNPNSNPEPAWLDLSSSNGLYLGAGRANNGLASWLLADGNYSFYVSPIDPQRTYSIYSLTVSGGVVSLRDSSGAVVPAGSDGLTTLTPRSSNFKMRYVSPVDGAVSVQTQIDINFTTGGTSVSTNLLGQASAYLVDGSYEVVTQTWGTDPTWTPRTYHLTVSGSGTLFNLLAPDGTPVAADSDGYFNVSPGIMNLVFNVVDPSNANSPILYPSVSLTTTTPDGSTTNNYGGSNGAVGATVTDGTYAVSVGADPSNPKSVARSYSLSVSSGTMTLTDDAGQPVVAVGGRFTVSAGLANVLLSVVKPGGSHDRVQTAALVVQLTQNDYQGYTPNNGLVGLKLADGTYPINVEPNPTEITMAQNQFILVVSNSGATVTVTDHSGSPLGTGTDGVFELPGSIANLPLQVVSPFVPGQLMTNAQVGYNLLDANGNAIWGTYVGTNQGRKGLNLADGHYQIIVQPNSPDTAIANSFYDAVVVGGQLVLTNQAGSAVSADANGIYSLAAGTSNFVAQIEDPAAPGVAWGHAYVNVDQVVAGGSRHLMGTNAGLGTLGLQLSDGSYLVQVQPDNGDISKTLKTYNVDVSLNGTRVAVTDAAGNPIAAASNGAFSLAVGQANVLGHIADPNGADLVAVAGSWTNVQLQKWSAQYNQWIYVSSSGADATGAFGVTVAEPGKYRLRIEPGGRSDVSTTYTIEFQVADAAAVQSLNKNLGKVNLNAPTLLVSARTSSGTSNLTWSQISVRDGNNTDWAFTGNSGIAPISFSHAGTYQVSVQPKGDGTTPNSTTKSYTVDVTTDANGLLVATVQGLTKESNGSYVLRLGVPNVSGTLTDPTETIAMPYDQILPMNPTTGELLWQYSTTSDSSGNWALNLPAGQYKLVSLAPSNLGAFGHGVSSSIVTIDSLGNATATGGANPSSLALRLSNPTWSGIVTEPGTASVMANVSVCLGFGQVTGTFNNTCTSTNQDGKWAITAPAEFTGFDDSSWLQINENGNAQYAQNRYQGKAALESALGAYVAGQQQTGILLKPKAPNTAITVTAGGDPVSNTWVQFYDAQGKYQGGAQTNIDGVAKVNLSNPGTDLTLDINVQNNQSLIGKYTGLRKLFTGSQFSNNNGFYSLSVALPKPNLQALVREPSLAADVVRNSYLDIFNGQDGSWVGNAHIDNNGFVSANLPAPTSGTSTYEVTVHNSWNATTNYVDKSYLATVDSTGFVTLSPKSGAGNVATENYLGNTVSTLFLSRPSVNGKVNLPDGVTQVANSWVSITDSQTNQWITGINSKQDGAFAAAIADGSYALEANVPWGTPGLAKSSPCLVTVSGGVTTTSGTNCVDSNGVVGLKLRAPNLTFTLMDGNGPNAKPVPFASVGMGLGAWNTWAQSDKNGQVSLFVDTAEIAAKNLNLTGTQALSVWVDPPFGNSNVVRWQCASGDSSKPLCGDLPFVTIGQDFNAGVAKDLGNVAFLQPNARLQVLYPASGGSAQPVEAGSWVAIYQTNQVNCSGCRNWVGGGNTDSNGFVSFNLPDVTSGATYSVEVNAPWQKRSQFAQTVTDGVLGSDLASTLVSAPTFSLSAPNLAVTVQQASGNDVSRWAGMGVEKIDATNGAWLGWVGWFGTDDKGVLSTLLASGARYRLTVYPGGGSKGTTTTCLVDVDSVGVVSLVTGSCADGSELAGTGLQTMTITLSLGNVTGTVVAPDHTTPVAGAIVVATAVDGSHSAIAGVPTQQFTTGADGKYGFQLDRAYSWDLKVYFVPVPGSGASYSSNLVPSTVQPGLTSTPIQLEVL